MTSQHLGTGADIFAAAANQVVNYLTSHTPIGDWSVSRVAHGEQVHLHVHREEILNQGSRVDWNEAMCQRMYAGAANVVADSLKDPDYADNPYASLVRSYAGFPILEDDGSLFGVLCGVGKNPLPSAADVDGELIDLFSRLLTSQLSLARVADQHHQDAELAAALAETDALTGLINRRGWDRLVVDAQRGITAFGDSVAIAVIDLNDLKHINDTKGHDAGDSLLRRAAETLRRAAGPGDRVARFGGDEFTILSRIGPEDMERHFTQYVTALGERDISAALGFAFCAGAQELRDTFAQADSAMYQSKPALRS